jgi:hypothetical protein
VDSNVLVKLPDSPELAAVRFGISLSCGKCNGVKNFDDIAEVYLKFLDYLNIDKDRVTK